MSIKEELLNEVGMVASSLGLDKTQCDELSNRIALILEGYTITEETTDLAIRETDEDLRMIRKFLMSKRIKGCTERTIDAYTRELRRSMMVLKKPLKEITVDDIRWFAADKEFNKGCSRVTCQNSLRVLSTLFTFLCNEGYTSRNPVMMFGTYKVKKPKKVAFTEYEIEMMRGVIKEPKDRAIFEVLLSTGCRVSELCQIKREEVSGHKIIVHGKGQKDRLVYLNTKAIVAIEEYIKWKNPKALDSKWLFPKKEYRYTCANPEEHIDKSSVEFIVRRTGNEAGVKAHPHKFRRTCATLALKRGMDLIYVSKMLGHDNVQTTQIYLDINEDTLEEQHRRYVI